MRILVTGSRDWDDEVTISDALGQFYHSDILTVVHGGARGADSIASDWVWFWKDYHPGLSEEVHPAEWDKYGKSAGHRRNAEMIASGIDFVLAFPKGDSPGTRGCIKLANKAELHIDIYEG